MFCVVIRVCYLKRISKDYFLVYIYIDKKQNKLVFAILYQISFKNEYHQIGTLKNNGSKEALIKVQFHQQNGFCNGPKRLSYTVQYTKIMILQDANFNSFFLKKTFSISDKCNALVINMPNCQKKFRHFSFHIFNHRKWPKLYFKFFLLDTGTPWFIRSINEQIFPKRIFIFFIPIFLGILWHYYTF